MPIYEYRCRECGHELERLQKMSDAPLTDCPSCGKQALQRLISAAGFRLKGGGWYETDFKKDGKRNLADSKETGGDKADKGSEGSGSEAKSKPESKSESKPEAKPAANSGSDVA